MLFEHHVSKNVEKTIQNAAYRMRRRSNSLKKQYMLNTVFQKPLKNQYKTLPTASNTALSLFLIYKHPLAPQVGVVQFCIEQIMCFENYATQSVEKHIHFVSDRGKSVGKPMFFETCVAEYVEKHIHVAAYDCTSVEKRNNYF